MTLLFEVSQAERGVVEEHPLRKIAPLGSLNLHVKDQPEILSPLHGHLGENVHVLFGAVDGDGDLGEFLIEKDNLSRGIHPSGQLREKPFQGRKEENLDDLFPVRVVAGVFLLVFYTPIIPVITTIAFKVTLLLFLGRHIKGFRNVAFGFLGFQFFGDGSPLPFFRYGKYRIFLKLLQEVAPGVFESHGGEGEVEPPPLLGV